MDPTIDIYSPRSPIRIGRPLESAMAGIRVDSIRVRVTIAELADPRVVEAINLRRCRLREPGKPITLLVYRHPDDPDPPVALEVVRVGS